jgi:hypothetical protein
MRAEEQPQVGKTTRWFRVLLKTTRLWYRVPENNTVVSRASENNTALSRVYLISRLGVFTTYYRGALY